MEKENKDKKYPLIKDTEMKKLKLFAFGYFVLFLFVAGKNETPYLTVNYNPSNIVNPECYIIQLYELEGVTVADTILLDTLDTENAFSTKAALYDECTLNIFAVNNFTKKDTISNVQLTYKRRGCMSCAGDKLDNMCFYHNGERKQGQEIVVD